MTLLAEDGTPIILAEPPPPRQPGKRVGAKTKARVAEKLDKPVDPYAGVPDAIDADPAPAPEATAVNPVDPYGDQPAPGRAPTAVKPPAPVIVDAGPAELADPYVDPGVAAFAAAVAAELLRRPRLSPGGGEDEEDQAEQGRPAAGRRSVVAGLGGDRRAEPAVANASTAATAAAAPTSAEGITVLAHGELDAALGDFSKLASTFRASFTTDGVRFEAVNAGTLLAKIGLRKGDVVMSVDGRQLRTLDDAASLYARSTTMKLATVQLMRGGKLMVLRVAIR